jgi:TonB family protein
MKQNNRFRNFIAFSIILHIGLAAFVFVLPKFQQHFAPVEIVLITPEEIENNLPKQVEDMANQIVETDEKNANETLNEKAKYLSAKNNTVEKETQAKRGEKFQNAQAIAKKPAQAQRKSAPSLFGEKFNAYDAMAKKAGNAEQNGFQDQQQAQNGLNRGIESTSTDALENVEQSLKTQLNTKEYKYYGYYQRIKNQLNQFWQPEVRQKVSRLMTKGRTIASDNNNKVTKLIIVLNDAGTLVKVQVIGESGVRDLDEAAVEAFRQAAPFPNPPKGMVETDGTIKIRWDFVVES